MSTVRDAVGAVRGARAMMQQHRAFTLVELMVVVALIALLSAIGLPNVARARQNADDAKTQKELQSIYTAIVMYENDHHQKPTTWTDLQPYITIANAENKYELNAN